ncbi:MAG: Crp/Fnr family transcriptional regulator [Proteobacteria bacterium]|nr:MAG: Crp/Fnr family transcriptional regulator [Pseudomonadota bacterium]
MSRVSGKNKILKKGELLFKAGDSSDGMYVLRKGQIQIFLDKGGNDIVLASVAAGGMIGEMSLFDKKPRSASARAMEETEVTQISNDDFNKIISQIPKWLVSLMATLSSRLRDTNERLQDLEAKYKGNYNPLEELIRTLQILILLYYKDGIKEGKAWILEREIAVVELAKILSLDKAKIEVWLNALIKGNMLSVSKNQYKKDVLNVANRGDLERFSEFARKLRVKNPNIKALPQDYVDILEMLSKMSKTSAYDTFSVDLKQLMNESKALGFRVDSWPSIVGMFVDVDDSVAIVKGPKDVSFKVTKKTIENFLSNSKVLRAVTLSEEKSSTRAA